MTILLVDDQQPILDGLLAGVPFNAIGFRKVLTAGDAEEAWKQLQAEPVDVLLTDIEMPGKTGLDLIRDVREQYPDVLCIPLTSHADFEFAKVSLRLGCFDYLVQPAPYADITACLRKAFERRIQMVRESHERSLANMVQVHEPGMTGQVVLKLFSPIPEEVEEALEYLTACGYLVLKDSPVRLCVVVDMPYVRREDPMLSSDRLLAAIRDSFMLAPGHPVPLITRNPYRQFMVLLCHQDGVSEPPCTEETLRGALEELTRRLKREPAIYVRPVITMDRISAEIPVVQRITGDNVTEKTGIIHADKLTPETAIPGTDPLPRWRSLLDQDKYDILSREIQAWLEESQARHPDLRVLSDLHQRWTQAFFEHLSTRNVNIMSLFTEEYTYAMYMDCFRTLQDLEKGIRFVIDAATEQQNLSLEKSDVDRAIAYIQAHLSQPILVTDVADHVSLSSEYFTRLFKKETGQSIKDYIIQAKINAARNLLARSDIPVSLVALEMGYDNFSHFTQIFKKACGVTPSEYRKEHRG